MTVRSENFVTPVGTALWCSLAKPRKYDADAPEKYEITVAFRKKDISPLVAVVRDIARRAHGQSEARSPIKPVADFLIEDHGWGDDDVMIRFASSGQAEVVSAGCRPLDAEKVYPGCLVRVSTQAYSYATRGNKGVSMGLDRVQLLRADERIELPSSRPSAADVFGELPAGFSDTDDLDPPDDGVPF